MVTQRWSREVVVREIRNLNQASPDLRHNAVASQHSRLVSAAVRYFGSWAAAVTAAGIDYVAIRRNSQKARASKITKWSFERIDSEVRRLVEASECLAAATARGNHPALFSAAVSPRYYGSWRAALTAVGVDYDSILSQSRNSGNSSGAVRGTKTLAKRLRSLGVDVRIPGTEAQARFPRLYRRAVNCFGSWELALTAAFEAPVAGIL